LSDKDGCVQAATGLFIRIIFCIGGTCLGVSLRCGGLLLGFEMIYKYQSCAWHNWSVLSVLVVFFF